MIGRTNAADGSKINGAVEEIKVAPGKIVKKGDFVRFVTSITGSNESAIATPAAPQNPYYTPASAYDENTAFVGYLDYSSSTSSYLPTFLALNTSGGEASVSASVQFPVTWASGVGGGIGVHAVAADKMLCSHKSAASILTIRLLQKAGATLTTLATTTISGVDTNWTQFFKTAANQCAICYTKNGIGYMRIVTFSDSLITVGSEVQITASTPSSSQYWQIAHINPGTFISAFRSASNVVWMRIAVVSGTSISTGTEVPQMTALIGSSEVAGIFPLTDESFAVYVQNGTVLYGSIRGTTITFSTPYALSVGGDSGYGFSALADARFIVTGGQNSKQASVKQIKDFYVASVGWSDVFTSNRNPYQWAVRLSDNAALIVCYNSGNTIIYASVVAMETLTEPAGITDVPYGIALMGGSGGDIIKVAVPGGGAS